MARAAHPYTGEAKRSPAERAFQAAAGGALGVAVAAPFVGVAVGVAWRLVRLVAGI